MDAKRIDTTSNLVPVNNRTCARCGQHFATYGREYICPHCRKPKPTIFRCNSGSLSFREQQVVALVHEAKSNKLIAYELCLTEGTVKEYLFRIFRKLNVINRTELALLKEASMCEHLRAS